jgi:DTW domain-containing protein YfiP
MNIESYHRQRLERAAAAKQFRELCTKCLQPEFGCYCPHVQRFDPKITFAILIHPIEVKRRIATGRMSHLCLEKSHLIMGQDYSNDPRVNRLLEDCRYHPVILYPGVNSQNLTRLAPQERRELFPSEKELLIFVVDGTWATARKMMRQSQNLKQLPRVCFSPDKPSNFRVRKQPAPGCYSTIEAIHHTIELIGDGRGFATTERTHDRLLHVFDQMVERQLEFIRTHCSQQGSTYRRPMRLTGET